MLSFQVNLLPQLLETTLYLFSNLLWQFWASIQMDWTPSDLVVANIFHSLFAGFLREVVAQPLISASSSKD